jgi:hypothetical protein
MLRCQTDLMGFSFVALAPFLSVFLIVPSRFLLLSRCALVATSSWTPVHRIYHTKPAEMQPFLIG